MKKDELSSGKLRPGSHSTLSIVRRHLSARCLELHCQLPFHAEITSSLSDKEVKHHWVWSVLGRVTSHRKAFEDENSDEAKELQQQLITVMQKTGMQHRKRCINHQELSPNVDANYNFSKPSEAKNLGVFWKPMED
ncbi:hypothetical protein NPIL_517441 [Nephila pilipes]|uniref:Uncharacterized protein n=1 Tax=Nephila pilipes TaxID=299642 RepID=A0A8X6UBF8_NEPPI|nr:hypothetical protein NPIL_517441 [Nephila pilipes]